MMVSGYVRVCSNLRICILLCLGFWLNRGLFFSESRIQSDFSDYRQDLFEYFQMHRDSDLISVH